MHPPMGEQPKSGGDPQLLARCAECGNIYPAQATGSGEFRPIGTEGECDCGNTEFELVSAE